MGIRVRYENALGVVEMTGGGESELRIIKMDGLCVLSASDRNLQRLF